MQGEGNLTSGNWSERCKARWIDWRNRVLASERFQRHAAANPILRPVARRRAAKLFDLLAGFTYTQTLLAAVETGLLRALVNGSCSEAELAEQTDLSHEAVIRLLRAAAALDLVEQLGEGRWALGETGASLQCNQGALAMIDHHRLLYADLADPVTLLREDRAEPTALSRFWSYAANDTPALADEPSAGAYSQLMAASQAMVASEALAAYSFGKHRGVLDLGGGHGAFAKALAAKCPALGIGIFDLPPVLKGTAPALAAAGLEGRVALHPGSFFDDPLPQGYDCITLVRILHDHDDEAAMVILRSAQAALPPGGTLVIAEPLAHTRGAEAMGDAYFGLYLWAMRSGRPRSASEYRAMLAEAGFARSSLRRTRLPVITSVVTAEN